MLFSDNIPDILEASPYTMAFIKIFDELQKSKTQIISDSIRLDNYGVLTDRKWLIKKLNDLGVSGVPFDYPLPILIQLLLNVGTLNSYKGSLKGLELYCSLLSLGEATIDASKYSHKSRIILLDSLTRGYLTEDNSGILRCLCGSTESIDPVSTLDINIRSKFFTGGSKDEALILGYLKDTVELWLPFGKKQVNIHSDYRPEFYYHELLNPYFHE